MNKNHPRLLTYLIVFLLLSFQACNQQVAGNYASGGCSAISVNNATSDSTISSSDGNLDSAGPIEIPITIAKGTEGIDPTSIGFSDAGSSNVSSPEFLTTPDFQTSDVLGTVSGSLISQTSGTIAIYIDNTFTITIEADSNGDFSFNITSSVLDKPSALVEVDDDFSNADTDVVSTPVIVTFYEDEFTNEIEFEVYTTNTDEDVDDDDIAINITEQSVATSHGTSVAFFGTNSSNQNIISLVAYDGALNDHLTNQAPQGFSELSYDINGNLYGASSATGALYEVSNTGTVSELNDFPNVPTSRRLKLHPSGQGFLASTIYVNNPTLNRDSLSFGIIDLDTGTRYEMAIRASETLEANDISLAWVSYNVLGVIKKYSNDSYEYLEYDVLQMIELNGTLLEDTTIASYSQASYMFALINNYAGDSDYTYFICDSSGTNQLCEYNRNTQTDRVLTNESFDVKNAVASWDGSYILYQISNGTSEQMVIYSIADEDSTYLGRGEFPVANPVDNNLISHLIEDPNGTFQIGVKSISNDKPANISLNANSDYQIPLNNGFYFIQPYGGLAPYTFESSNTSVGTISESFGLFLPQSLGTSVITVTDANGDTDTVTLTVAADIALTSPSSGKLRVNEVYTVPTNGGGSTDLSFRLTSGVSTGALTAEGVYTAPSVYTSSTVTIEVEDEFGNTDSISFSLLGASGDFNTDFSTDGIVDTTLLASEVISDLVIDDDGNLYLIGAKFDGVSDKDFMIRKYLPTGEVDVTYGTAGEFLYDIGNSVDEAKAGAIDSMGRIVLVGQSDGGNNDGVIMRVNTDGTIDNTFGESGGYTETSFGFGGGQNEQLDGLVLLDNGKFMAYGTRNNGGNLLDYLVVRFDSNGSLDATFSGDGVYSQDFFNKVDQVKDLVVLPDDSYIVIGTATNATDVLNTTILKLDSSGNLDNAFDGDGVLSFTDAANNNEITTSYYISTSRLLLGGRTDENGDDDVYLRDINPTTGADNTGFGSSGIIIQDNSSNGDAVMDLDLANDGENLVMTIDRNIGGINTTIDVRIIDTDGNRVSTFNSNADFVANPSSGNEQIYQTLVANDLIYVLGTQRNYNELFLFSIWE